MKWEHQLLYNLISLHYSKETSMLDLQTRLTGILDIFTSMSW